MLGEASITSRERESTQVNLFGEATAPRDPALPQVDQWTMPDRLAREFAAIGFYMSAHPLDEFAQTLARLRVVPYAELAADKRHEERAGHARGQRHHPQGTPHARRQAHGPYRLLGFLGHVRGRRRFRKCWSKAASISNPASR